MGIPQDWAPYSSVEEAAKVYLRDPELGLDQLRSVIDLSAIKSFIMSRGATEESWGEAIWQEVVLTDGRRLIMWRADDECNAFCSSAGCCRGACSSSHHACVLALAGCSGSPPAQ